MKIVKISHPYNDATTFRQTPGENGVWEDYEFHMNDGITECDYWIILNTLPENQTVKCPKNNVFLWAGEPISIHKYNEEFVKQFANVITVQKEITHNAIYSQVGSPWFVEKTYDELKAISKIEKTNILSVVTSNKQFTEGHKKRYDFVMKLKEHFGDKLDLYGKGIRAFDLKWDTLSPYKFSIAIENSQSEDYFTEKLADCYLAYTYPFYYGCPNVDKYFSQDSYTLIDIENIDKSIKIIEDVLNNKNFYEEHFEAIKESREKCLEEYNLFPMLKRIFDETKYNDKNKKNITLNPEEYFDSLPPKKDSLLSRGAKKIKKIILG